MIKTFTFSTKRYQFSYDNVYRRRNERRPRQKGKPDRHGNLENANKTEHDLYTYKTMNNADPTKKPGVHSGGLHNKAVPASTRLPHVHFQTRY